MFSRHVIKQIIRNDKQMCRMIINIRIRLPKPCHFSPRVHRVDSASTDGSDTIFPVPESLTQYSVSGILPHDGLCQRYALFIRRDHRGTLCGQPNGIHRHLCCRCPAKCFYRIQPIQRVLLYHAVFFVFRPIRTLLTKQYFCRFVQNRASNAAGSNIQH